MQPQPEIWNNFSTPANNARKLPPFSQDDNFPVYPTNFALRSDMRESHFYSLSVFLNVSLSGTIANKSYSYQEFYFIPQRLGGSELGRSERQSCWIILSAIQITLNSVAKIQTRKNIQINHNLQCFPASLLVLKQDVIKRKIHLNYIVGER